MKFIYFKKKIKKMKKMKKMKTQPNLVNDGSKEPQKQDEYSTSSYDKKWLILSFCGGAYPKFGMKIHRTRRRCIRDEIIKKE